MNANVLEGALTKLNPTGMFTRPYQVRVFTDDSRDFKDVHNSNVLIYFPHGFGDWVQLCYILQHLDKTNRYWITRFGDDNTSLMEGHEWVSPIYLGVNNTHSNDGGHYTNRHFGLEYSEASGSDRTVQLPLPLYEECKRHHIETILWTAFPETAGHEPRPFHTKARSILRTWRGDNIHEKVRLERPIKSSINFQVAPFAMRWVESRLKSWAGFGQRRLCIIGRGGYTSVGKNWGHLWREDMPPEKQREGEECRDFIDIMLKKNPNWLFLLMEDRLFEGADTSRNSDMHAHSYAELFGTPDTSSLPFGLVMKALVNLADLSIGVPAAPYHLSMAKPELPTIGIWTEHLPSWFDEPKPASIHVVSKNAQVQCLFERPGSFAERDGFTFKMIHAETRIIEPELVLSAVETLL